MDLPDQFEDGPDRPTTGSGAAFGGPHPSGRARRPAVARRSQDDFSPLGDLLGDQFDAQRPVVPRPGPEVPVPGELVRRPAGVAAARPVDLAAAISLSWPDIVGEEGAANSQPVRLRQGRLTVAASSTVWAQTLQFMEQTIVARLNERLAALRSPVLDIPLVERVSFRHAGWQEPARLPAPQTAKQRTRAGRAAPEAPEAPGTAAGPAGPAAVRGDRSQAEPASALTPEQLEALHSVEELHLEPQLAAKIMAAMRAAFVRDQQDSVR